MSTDEFEPSTRRRDKPPADSVDASQTLRLGNGAIRISKQGIGISLQTGTLLTLLGVGWQAKGALDEQLEQFERTRTEFEERHTELEKELHQISLKVQSALIGSEQVVALQIELAGMRSVLSAYEIRIEKLEDKTR